MGRRVKVHAEGSKTGTIADQLRAIAGLGMGAEMPELQM